MVEKRFIHKTEASLDFGPVYHRSGEREATKKQSPKIPGHCKCKAASLGVSKVAKRKENSIETIIGSEMAEK